MKMKPTAFKLAYLKQFEGKRITKVEFVDIGEFIIPTLNFDDGTFAMIWCDDEGNGPGSVRLYSLNTGYEIFPEKSE